MKLISCYIENFGCLSQYTQTFNSGVTAIEEVNGFGKTTLAEFIRAMFYGFPRFSKALSKNPRKKYAPWQGGTYGGNLVFEENGKKYKIERTFGDVPRHDTFMLYDQKTHRKSLTYSENIGVELFGLDADSFERSTYMPQMREITSFSTDNIQAKLGNLLEDTNDVNNFDKAIAALRTKRSALKAFRGESGSVVQAQRNISSLQQQISDTSDLAEELQGTYTQLDEQRESLLLKQKTLKNIRRHITEASEAIAKQAIMEQYQSLQQSETETENALSELRQKYPSGIPTTADLNRVDTMFSTYQSIAAADDPTDADRDAEKIVRQNTSRFANTIPSASDFSQQHEIYSNYISCEGDLKNSVFSADEAREYQSLSEFFQNGVPEGALLNKLQEENDKLQSLQTQRHSYQPDPSERARLQNLESFFASGVPSDADLDQQQESISRIDLLRKENIRLASVATPEPPKPVPESEPIPSQEAPSPLLMVLGAILTLVGIILLTVHQLFFAAVGIVIGMVMLITAIYLKFQYVVSTKLSASTASTPAVSPLTPENQAVIQENERSAAILEEKVMQFTSKYISDGRSLTEKLVEIRTKKQMLLELRAQNKKQEQFLQQLNTDADSAQRRVLELLRPYFPHVEHPAASILTLRENLGRYQALSQRKKGIEIHAKEVRQTQLGYQAQIQAFLRTYSMDDRPEHFGASLAELQRLADSYATAVQRLEENASREALRQKQVESNTAKFHRFTDKYALDLELGDQNALNQLREDRNQFTTLEAALRHAHSATVQFYKKNQEKLDTPIRTDLKDLDALKMTEEQLSDDISDLTSDIVDTEQTAKVLQDQFDQIPQMEDNLEFWKNQQAGDLQRVSILDHTMQFLQEARDSLSNHYLDDIQRNFKRYTSRLIGSEENHISMSADLQIQIEKLGQARELDYFSTGQNDLVLLCMRLALVDTLFEDSRPFIILDDPFINLDDNHTEKALTMLQNLGKDHQIIYLYCNSSRRLK